MNFKEILHAWKKAANPTPQEEQIAEQRHKICDSCPSYKSMAGLFPYCAECLCPIDKKVFADNKDSCPLKKWPI